MSGGRNGWEKGVRGGEREGRALRVEGSVGIWVDLLERVLKEL